MAVPAFALQEEPAQNRNVVVGSNRRLAAGAVRSGANDGLAFRNARYADIQETADDHAKKEKEERDHSFDCAIGVRMPQSAESGGVSDG